MSETSTPTPPAPDAAEYPADGTADRVDGTAASADADVADNTGDVPAANTADAAVPADNTADDTTDDSAEGSDAGAQSTPDTSAGDVPDSARSAGKPATPRLSPEATAIELKQRFPALFTGAPKPVKLRVHVDINARAPGVFNKPGLTAFFRRHMGSTAYLIALTKASHRYDLDGQPVEALSDEHRQAALQELDRRRDLRQSRQAQEDDERRNRATLLRDYENTTLTPANFGALKGLTPEVLEEILAIARREAAEPPRFAPPQDRRGPPPGRRGPPPDGREGPRGGQRGHPHDAAARGGPRDAPRTDARPGPRDAPQEGPRDKPRDGPRADGPRNPPRTRR